MLKKISFYFLLILNIKIIASTTPVCISLGEVCGPALILRELKIRTEAFPFDWIISPFNAFYNALTSDFALFLTDLKMRPDNTGVIDHYGFNFTHDWPTIHNPLIDPLKSDFVGACQLFNEWEKAVPFVMEKYRRRIERFKSICLSDNKIIFIRIGLFSEPKKESIMIRDFFKNKYPELNFILIVISSQEVFREDWELERIRNFHSYQCNAAELVTILQKVDPAFARLHNRNIATESVNFAIACKQCLAIQLEDQEIINK